MASPTRAAPIEKNAGDPPAVAAFLLGGGEGDRPAADAPSRCAGGPSIETTTAAPPPAAAGDAGGGISTAAAGGEETVAAVAGVPAGGGRDRALAEAESAGKGWMLKVPTPDGAAAGAGAAAGVGAGADAMDGAAAAGAGAAAGVGRGAEEFPRILLYRNSRVLFARPMFVVQASGPYSSGVVAGIMSAPCKETKEMMESKFSGAGADWDSILRRSSWCCSPGEGQQID